MGAVDVMHGRCQPRHVGTVDRKANAEFLSRPAERMNQLDTPPDTREKDV